MGWHGCSSHMLCQVTVNILIGGGARLLHWQTAVAWLDQAQFRVGGALPSSGVRLRTLATDGGRGALYRLRLLDVAPVDLSALQFITGARLRLPQWRF